MSKVDQPMKKKTNSIAKMSDHRNRLNKKARKESYNKRKQQQRNERWA